MKITRLEIPDVMLIEPDVFADKRGHFFELWQGARYSDAGIAGPFIQDNASYSAPRVLRGLHYQWPTGQGKLVSVLAGSVFDVAVDVRRGSSTFGRWVGRVLSSQNHHQLWIPPGFAHGFTVRGDEGALISYKVTAPFAPGEETTIAWNDPRLNITWEIAHPVLSERDATAPVLSAVPVEKLPSMPSHTSPHIGIE